MCNRNNCNSNSNSNKAGLALTFGIGAAIGAATYFFLNSATEEEPQPRQHRRSSDGSGQHKKWRENNDRPDTCSICLEQIPAMSARTLLGCGHEFHTTCVEPWVERNAHCPVCRQAVQ